MSKATYPKREPFFAHRFVRLLTKTAAAQELGPEVAWLLTVVAHQEDAKRYSGAVTYWNEQLMPLCGFRSKGRLNRARQAAIDASWLHYESGGKNQAGRYWCLIPEAFGELPDGPCDESDPVQNRTANGSGKAHPVQNRTANGTQADLKRNSNGPLSTLVLDPDPKGESASAESLSADQREFTEAWSTSGLTRCRKLTDKRRKALRTRLADPDWKASWREALDRAAQSSFCRGQNDRGWKADIEWFLQPDSVVKLLEGKYDDQKPRTGQRTASDADDIMEKHTADVLAGKRAEREARQTVQKGGAS